MYSIRMHLFGTERRGEKEKRNSLLTEIGEVALSGFVSADDSHTRCHRVALNGFIAFNDSQTLCRLHHRNKRWNNKCDSD
jgi:hypothetical protein